MTVIPGTGLYSGGNKITLVTWFYVDSLDGNDNGFTVGSGYDVGSNAIPTGGNFNIPTLDASLMTLGGSLIPIFEWGYAVSGANQGASGLYIDPPFDNSPFGNKTKGSVLFVARGPAVSSLVSDNSLGEMPFATVSSYLFGFHNATGIDRSLWLPKEWNVLIMSADLSPLDTLVGPDNLLANLQHYIVNKKIWANLNGAFDTVGGGDLTGFEQGYPIPGGNALYQGFYQTSGNTWTGQPALSMMAGEFDVPCRDPWASANYNYATVCFGTTQVWFNSYIDPTQANYDKFYTTRDGKLFPLGGVVAANFFGTPDIWYERDNVSGVKFEDNQGAAGSPQAVGGTTPIDFNPSPTDNPPV